jgi:hypothetical protein
VSQGSLNPTPPYATWDTAATNIQVAINAAAGSDTVLVTNGVYPGGVVLSKPLTLLSANGPQVTVIDGGGASQCVSMADLANLSGFTLTNGFAANGGGLWCNSTNAYVTNCLIIGNVATNGGGVYAGTLYNCMLKGNSVAAGMYGTGGGACSSKLYNCLLSGNSATAATYGTGGGACYCDLYDCTVTGNSAYQSGGIAAGTMNNCIVYYNSALYYSNYYAWANNYCCTMPMPTNGVGNITNAPLFVDPASGHFQLQSGSPCINAGNNAFVFGMTDLDGNSRISGGTVDMGAYEFQWSGRPSIFLQPTAQSVYAGSNAAFTVGAGGSPPLAWQWNFNGTALAEATNSSLALTSVTTNQAGGYSVVITNSQGSVTSQVAVLTVVDVKPSITSQPIDQTVFAGTNVIFTASAVGSLPMSWQWVFNSAAISDATNSSLTFQMVTTNQAGGYSVIVTNSLGSVTSQVVVLTVIPVSITLQPLSQAVPFGSDVTFTAGAVGTPPLLWQWQFNGTAILDATNSSLTLMAVTTNATGTYSVTVGNAFGSTNSAGATLAVLLPTTSYVWQDSPNPSPPYSSWATAARTIQDAVDIAIAGDEIVVTNGIYATGGRWVFPSAVTNRVAVDKPVIVHSVNGPGVTIIQGYQVPLVTNDYGAIRCVYLTNGAVLSGFTLTGGATWSYEMGASFYEMIGGGVYCASTNATVSNCVLSANSAWFGAGTYSGTLNNCIVTGNSAVSQGGGAAAMNLDACILNNCGVISNRAYLGGGAYDVTLNNCTVTGNLASEGVGGPAPAQGGGVGFDCKLYNSIVVSNFADVGSNFDITCTLSNCCATPLPLGAGNIDQDPLFVDFAAGNLHLQSNSLCINAGNNSFVFGATDLDGNPRIVGFRVDIGAYEFQSLAVYPPGTHYVWQSSPSPTPPFTNWNTAAHVLQDAVDVATAGDEVVVTNGIYATGGRTFGTSLLTNRVAVDKQLTISSVNGPDMTIIQGYQVPGVTNGDAAVRCVYLSSNAVLSGFSLTNGATRQVSQNVGSDAIGGGVYSDSWSSGLVTHCKLIANSAADSGGGAFSCSLDNCLLTGNSAANEGGGANFCALTNCTVTGNTASYGGGAAAGLLFNCIVYYNNAIDSFENNWLATIGSMMSFSCTTPLPGPVEWQNIANAPLFVDPANGDFHLQPNSPCINAGTNGSVDSATGLDGNPRIVGGTVDMGAYEFQSLALTPPMIHYVWQASPAPTPPFTNWDTAAHVLQDAVDAASAGDTVLVTNGLYATGGRVVGGTITNRVALDRAITLASVNGPVVTVIEGAPPTDVNGQTGIRCAYVGTNAVLSGFTVRNGYAVFSAAGTTQGQLGGGAWCETSAVVTNCTFTGNSAQGGAGVSGGTLNNCVLTGNSAEPSYSFGGGGAYQATLNNCLVISNSASGGGGASGGTLNNCTLCGNFGILGGGALWAALNNCIVYYNMTTNWYGSTLNYCCTTPAPDGRFGNITNAPLFVDQVNGDFHLQANSPCINAGNHTYVRTATDLDGNPRIVGTPDIGAYEFQAPTSLLSYAWLQQYGLPGDGSADFIDSDGDGMNNWQEWVCGTDPTNALSVLRMLSAVPTSTNVTVSWQSVAGINYFLERSSDLSSTLALGVTTIVGVGTNIVVVPTNVVLVATNILGQGGTTTFIDTNATGGGSFFYRVGIYYP